MAHAPRRRGESWEAYAARTYPKAHKPAGQEARTPREPKAKDNVDKLLHLQAKAQPHGNGPERPQTDAMAQALATLNKATPERPAEYMVFDVRDVQGPTANDAEEHGRGQRSAVKGKKLHIRRAHRTWVHGALLGK